uniref:INO80 complex subunit B-like conserved region domain-containing protein n=1 Tax=Guillardia theta TaxID=55529 RepID=A0A7S4KEX9_GUITH|mmetsp:Transcript_2376/g.7268  ORF Transcript_2376/g.7268 Transcript_2376/m.7268 type:complete len:300 (+) Transcript_2376:34-933(+)
MAEEAEELKWRCHVVIKLNGQRTERCKCTLPIEFRKKFFKKKEISADLPISIPKLKIKLPTQAATKSDLPRYKVWPKVHGVPFPGRSNPVSIVIKLAIPGAWEDSSETIKQTPRSSDEYNPDADVAEQEDELSDEISDGNDSVSRSSKQSSRRSREHDMLALPMMKEKSERKEADPMTLARRAEHLRRRKEQSNKEKDEKTASTIERILNAEGQSTRKREREKKKDQEPSTVARKERKCGSIGPHIRCISNAEGMTVSVSKDCVAQDAPLLFPVPQERQKGLYTEPPALVEVPWWALEP